MRHKSFDWLPCVLFVMAYPWTAPAQEVLWQRQVQGILGGVVLAFYHGGAEYTKPVLADLDGDGDGDLYVGEHDGYLNVFENLGGNPPNWYCVTTALDTIDVGKQNAPAFWDIDLDGDLDLFIGEEDGNVWYYRNDGPPQAPSWTFQTSNYGLILVDHHAIPFFQNLDADDDDDLLVGHNEGGAALFLNAGSPGNPLWSYQTAFYQGIDVGSKSAPCVFDVDGDSLGDLFMTGQDGQIHYYHNDGPPETPTYSEVGIIFDVGSNGVPTLWDLDQDGDLDVICGEANGNLNLITNTGTPTAPHWEFSMANLAYFDAGFYSMPALVDIDGDQDLDLFIGRVPLGIVYIENVGSPDSAAWELVSMTYANINLLGQEAPAFQDLDDDGDQDMLIGSEDGALTYYQNIGTAQSPTWEHPDSNYANVDVGYNSAPAFADADGDSLMDLFIGSYDGTLRYLRNVGSPSQPVWQDLGNYPGVDAGTHSTPAFADLDGDGDLDLLLGSGTLTGTIHFYRNVGAPLLPAWTLESDYYQNWDFGDYSAPCLTDLDGDGDADLLVGCESGGVYLMDNLGLLYDVSLALLPYNPPIVIPPEGGSFQYIIRVENNESEAQRVVIWTELTMPNGQTYGPLVSIQQMLPPGITSQLENQAIADTFPAGQYACIGYVGFDSILIYSTDSFTFIKGDTLSVQDPQAGGLPGEFYLAEPHPNPFNASVQIEYNLPVAGWVDLALYDLDGRQAAVIRRGWEAVGLHSVQFKPPNLSSGIYFLRLEADKWAGLKKICYVK